MSEQTTKPTVAEAVSLVVYRRQLLADAQKERASMQRLVRRCERALDEADKQLTRAIVDGGLTDQPPIGRGPQREIGDILAGYGLAKEAPDA
jgi:hypothetical protein